MEDNKVRQMPNDNQKESDITEMQGNIQEKAESDRADLPENKKKLKKENTMRKNMEDKDKNFDKKRLLENVRNLLSHSEVKLGQIERDAGCQPGYMSRLEKPGNNTDPTIEFVVTAAKELAVSLDMLVYGIEISPAEKSIMNFLTYLMWDTRNNSMYWTRETSHMISNIKILNYITGITSHPLFKHIRKYEQSEQAGRSIPVDTVYYDSKFFPGEAQIGGNCYHTALNGTDAEVYLMKCVKISQNEKTDDESLNRINPPEPFYEMYLVSKNKNEENEYKDEYNYKNNYKVNHILCTLETSNIFVRAVDDLYKAIEALSAQVHFDREAEQIISKFLESHN